MEITNGAIKDLKDDRDYVYEAGLGAGPVMTDKDWQEGFDIENIVGKLTPKNQYQSYSCVGQAYSQYKAVLDAIEESKYSEQSAKAIYSQISLGYAQGAYLREGAKKLVDWGSLLEKRLKSYKDDGTTDETFMIDKSWLTEELTKEASSLKGKEYKLITGNGIDYFAKAIKEGKGCVIGVTGINNGTWTSLYPKPPKMTDSQSQTWGHALFAGRFRLKDWKKEIGILNSWGDVGDRGWQWLGEEWFADEGRWIFNPWVIIDNNNKNMSTSKILKDRNSKAVGLWMPAISEDVLKSYCLNAGKEIPMKDGHIDWDKIVEGDFTYR